MTQARFVHIVDEVPELDDRAEGPVLVCSLRGFLDAGNASALATAQILDADEGRVVASFEVDEFYDYRARRPPMTFQQDRYTDYEAPRLVVRLVSDRHGSPYLLMTGPEPDFRWEGFATACRQVIEHFGVRLVVATGSVPMAVPHTRPVQLTNHATASRLLVQDNVWSGTLRIPASAQALLEIRLGEWGHDALGFVAHIPHYAAQMDYPAASVAILEGIEDVTGLQWNLDELTQAGLTRIGEITQQVQESEEVGELVVGLERQFDAFHAQRDGGENLLASDEPLPSGEEIGAQFEQFLAALETPEED